MTSTPDTDSDTGTDGDTAGAGGGEGWAKTVVEGVAEHESAPPGSPPGAGDGGPTEDPDDEIVEAELLDEPAGSDATTVDADPDPDPADDAANDTGTDDAAGFGEGAADGQVPVDGQGPDGEVSVEALVSDLERVSAERDQYLDASRRLQAEFENYKKQIAKREADARERANDSLIGELLPVLDAFDGALASGAEDVAPMRSTFLDALAKQGLERIDPIEAGFDPTLHEAVMHEADDETDGPMVAEVMRAGYVWKGRVLRPAMVKTRG